MKLKLVKLVVVLGLFAVAAIGLTQTESKVKLEGNEERRKLLSEIQGKPAPDLEVAEWMGGKEVKLSDLKGKVVLLEFWGKW